jgi:hypothetical protein
VGRRIGQGMRGWHTFLPLMLLAAACGGPSTPTPAASPSPLRTPPQEQIAFARAVPVEFDIYVMNADGTGVRQLTEDPARDTGPAWSPDGTKIGFAGEREGDEGIYVMNADGTGVRHSPTTRPTTSPRPGRPTAARSPSTPTGTETPRST